MIKFIFNSIKNKLSFQFIVAVLLLNTLTGAMAQTPGYTANKSLVSPINMSSGVSSNLLSYPAVPTAHKFWPYDYIIQIKAPNTNLATTWNVQETFPPGFVWQGTGPGQGCEYFIGPNTAATACPPFNANTSTWAITPVPVGTTYISLVVHGYFDDNANSNSHNEAIGNLDGSLTTVGTANTNINYQGLPYNLKLSKEAFVGGVAVNPSNSMPFSAIDYKIKIENTSATNDANMFNIVYLLDVINASPGIMGTISAVNCVPSSGSSCVTSLPAAVTASTVLNNYNLFGGSGLTGGLLKAGGDMTLSYTITPQWVSGTCAQSVPQILNTAYLNLSGVGAQTNFPDNFISDNTSAKSVQLDNTPTVVDPNCSGPGTPPPPSPLTISKKIISNNPSSMYVRVVSYRVEVTNPTTSSHTFTMNDYVYTPTAAITAFVAGFSASLAPTSTSVVGGASLPTAVGSSPVMLVSGVSAFTLPPSSSVIIEYKVEYTQFCHQKEGNMIIVNTAYAHVAGFMDASANETIKMDKTELCAIKGSKTVAGNSSPISFPAPLHYKVKWVNSSPQPLLAGKVMDTLSIDSALYANLPVSYSNLLCSGSGVSFPTPASSGSFVVTPMTWLPQGASMINLSNVTFSPYTSLHCEYDLIVNRPLINDKHCQTEGKPQLINFMLSDPNPDVVFNQNLAPGFPVNFTTSSNSSTHPNEIVPILLPLCLDFGLNKIADPSTVLPGDPINWTITATNNAPVGNGPSSGFTLTDVLPIALGAMSGHNCVPNTGVISNCLPLSSSAGATLTETVTGLAVGDSVTQKFQTSSPNYVPAAVLNTVKFAHGADTYLKNGVVHDGTWSINTNWPSLTKKFSPATVVAGQVSNLTFTVQNLSYNPPLAGMAFTDTLTGLVVAGPVSSNTCTGNLPVALIGSNVVSWSGGAISVGLSSCSFTVPVTQANFALCPANYQNSNTSNISGGIKLDTSGVMAQLQVNCPDNLGVVKICKVAGPNVNQGTLFTFNVGGNTLTVPAGPAPGGYCVPSPQLPVGSTVSVTENNPANIYNVTAIQTQPAANQISQNLSTGNAVVTVGQGVTEVTFKNERNYGYIEICKIGQGKNTLGGNNFNFTVSGVTGTVVVPMNACSPAIQVLAGLHTVTETNVSFPTKVVGCQTFPSGLCNMTALNTVSVNVAGGGISSQTILYIKNSNKLNWVESNIR